MATNALSSLFMSRTVHVADSETHSDDEDIDGESIQLNRRHFEPH